MLAFRGSGPRRFGSVGQLCASACLGVGWGPFLRRFVVYGFVEKGSSCQCGLGSLWGPPWYVMLHISSGLTLTGARDRGPSGRPPKHSVDPLLDQL